MRNFILTLIALFLLVSCDEDLNKQRDDIVGTWDWQRSTGGLAGVTNTPESLGYNQEIIFQENGIYTWYRADTVFDQGNYDLGEELTIYSNDPIPVVHLEHHQVPIALIKLDRDSLIFAYDCNDCLVHEYIRMNSQ